MSKMLLRFSNEGIDVEIELIEDEAPRTVKAIQENAPYKGDLIHDIWSGPQVFLPVMSLQTSISPENLTMFVEPGDVFFFSRGENAFRGSPYGYNSLAEIGIAYDRDAAPRGPAGQKSINIFGKVTKGFAELKDVCSRMLFEGSKPVEIIML